MFVIVEVLSKLHIPSVCELWQKGVMIQSPNYIHFRCKWQLLGPDSPRQSFERRTFQDLMNALNDPPDPIDFDDFSFRPGRCEMGKFRGNRPEGGAGFRKLIYGNDQLTLVEEWADISADDFQRTFVRVLSNWFKLFPTTVIIAQTCCLRALVQPVSIADSRQFLGGQVLGIGPAIQKTFKDMPFKVGFTVTVPRQIENNQLVIDTTVNSWRDNRSIWVQVNGSSPMAPPINATNPETAKVPFGHCKDFLETEAICFLNEYDKTN
jgi:hypothetical protein